MNPNCEVLSGSALQSLSDCTLTSDQLRQLEQHVDGCPHCIAVLEASQSGGFCQELVSSLAAPVEPLPASFDELPEHAPSAAALLRMLGPTDDPHMLGRIDSYEVAAIVGRGGMGVVFKAMDRSLNRFVAIKMLLPHLAESGAARKRFAREARAAAAVVDDHVLPIHGVAEWNGVPYIVSPFCRGVTLEKRIRDEGPLGPKELIRIAMQTAQGLAAAHSQGLVHRDVKPANILLDTGVERVQLSDFGLARAADDASMTRSGMLAGTPQYMSPEQTRGEPLDGRSDLFALGSVMYAMATGRPPFLAEHPLAVMQKIATERVPLVHLSSPGIPRPLSAMIDRLLEKRPADRIQSAAEVADLLRQYLAHLEQPDAFRRPRLRRRSIKSPAMWATLAIAVAATLIVATVWSGWFSDPAKTHFANSEKPSGVESSPPVGESSSLPGNSVVSAEMEATLSAYEQDLLDADAELDQLLKQSQSSQNFWSFSSEKAIPDSLEVELDRLRRETIAVEATIGDW